MNSRQLIEVNPQNPPKIFAPQSVIVKSEQSDGGGFQVDIGRICYLSRDKDSNYANGKSYTHGDVCKSSLSTERADRLRNFLNEAFQKGWRNETLRGRLHCVRYFFSFCDFDEGQKPVSLEEFVSEYQRYQLHLIQRGRLNGSNFLSSTSINQRLVTARNFIQWGFQLSNTQMLALLPKHRALKPSADFDFRVAQLKEGQEYLAACRMYFNQFADAILENRYPIHVSPPNSVDKDLYWHSARGTTLKSLPGCFDQDFKPYPFCEVKEIIAKNFKDNKTDRACFYKRTLVKNRSDWMSGKLMVQKVYAFNLASFCFFHLYIGFTAANVQPTLDLKLSDLDLASIGASSFARKHKFRSGRSVTFSAPSQLKREVLKYLKLRKWVSEQGLKNEVDDFLFVKIAADKSIKRLGRDVGACLVRNSPLFSGVKKLTSRELRQLASEYFIRKSKGKISLVAKKLNNSIATVAKSYTAIDIASQANEMNDFYEELSSKVRLFNRDTNECIPIKIAKNRESERVASGSCSNLNGQEPSRVNGFNKNAPEPSCGTFESCLFCKYFALHIDIEDLLKLLSLKEALKATALLRNDPEHFQAVIQPALERVDEIIEFVSEESSSARKTLEEVQERIKRGEFDRFWSEQINALNGATNVLEREFQF